MVRVRKLVLAIAAASALSSGVAHALGLGEVTLKSTLNQPLDAEIELLEVRDLSSDEVLPKLASPEDFIKAGVDRQYFLTDLKFTPIVKANGRSAIRVTSNKAVREPYLNFVVEVLWPNGRLLREYTLLLDPPLYSPQTTAAVAPQIAAVAPVTAPVQRTAPVAPAAQPVRRAEPRAIAGNEYRTTSNDTLWEIAQQVGGGSVHQTMLAIAELNPDAFIGGNINRMKTGQVLRLPDEQQIRSRTNAQAVAEVAEHNKAWREGRSVAARQLDATHKAVTSEAPARVETGDSLKLVAADAGQVASGSDTGAAERKALADTLAVTQESLDSSRSENAELQGRLEDLQSQLEKLQKLVELKDNQLAQMQANMAAVAEAPVPEAAPVESVPVAEVVAEPVVDAPKSAIVEAENAAVEQAEVVEPVAAEVTEATEAAPVVESAEIDYNYNEEPAPVVAESQAPVVEESVVAESVAAEQAEPASFIDDFMSNPASLGLAGGGAILLLLGLLVLSRRNASKEAQLQAELAEQNSLEPLDSPFDSADSSFDDLLEETVEAAPQPAQERVSAQTADALGEADIYIAYGRFNQAAELLQTAVNDEPQRADLRLKLMEVQAELGDRDGFARQERELREMGGSVEEIERLRGKFPQVAAVAAAAAAFAAPVQSEEDELTFDDLLQEAPLEPTKVEDDAFDLSLDAFENSFDAPAVSAEEPAPLAEDFDFSLPETTAEAAPVVESDFDLTFEGLSLDEGVDLAEPAPAQPVAADEFSFELDAEPNLSVAAELDDVSFDLELPASTTEAPLSADFDLSLGDDKEELLDLNADQFTAKLDDVAADLDELSLDLDAVVETDLDADDDFDFLSGTDEASTKLDLARAYIDMGDAEGARDILEEVVAEGSEAQQAEARELIAKLV